MKDEQYHYGEAIARKIGRGSGYKSSEANTDHVYLPMDIYTASLKHRATTKVSNLLSKVFPVIKTEP